MRAVIADVRALSSLNELDLSESSITDDGLGEIVRGRRLNIINVSDTQIVGTGLAELEPDCLHELVAENSAFNDRGMKSIKSQERLFEINVKNCPVSDVGLERIERCSGLGWILLGGTEISDKSVDGVLGASRMPTIYRSRMSQASLLVRSRGCAGHFRSQRSSAHDARPCHAACRSPLSR